jgi:hypothetical protein
MSEQVRVPAQRWELRPDTRSAQRTVDALGHPLDLKEQTGHRVAELKEAAAGLVAAPALTQLVDLPSLPQEDP